MTITNAALAKRSKSNLLVKNKFALSKEDSRKGFAGLLNKAYPGDAYTLLLRAVLAPFGAFTPVSLGSGEGQEGRSIKRNLKAAISALRNEQLQFGAAELVRLTKYNTGFQVDIPILTGSTAAQKFIEVMFDGPLDEAKALEELQVGSKLSFSFNDIVTKAKLPASLSSILSSCSAGGYYHRIDQDELVGYLSFLISKEEAESFTNQEFLTIRPTDIYPLLSLWRAADFDKREYGTSAIAVSRIAATLPKHLPEDVRLDKFGLSVGPTGHPMFILRDCDNTAKYEDLYFAAGQKGDTFAMRSKPTDKAKLPANIPVLVDWVNQKFSYTNTAGSIIVDDLAHNRACSASAAVNIMRRLTVDKRHATKLNALAGAMGVPLDMGAYRSRITLTDDNQKELFERYTNSTIHTALNGFNGKTWYEVASSVLEDGAVGLMAQHLMVFLFDLAKKCADNPEVLYQTYSVHTITQDLGWIVLVGRYGGDLPDTENARRQETAAARTQGEDPEWAPPPCPLVTSKLSNGEGGLLPHQAKVRNMLKDLPKNAVLPVAAGGGKSMLSITDILYFLDAGFTGPFLLMCPSHLVPNYVSEVVEFTDGRLNAIPVTSYNIRTSGFARYEKLLENAPRNTALIIDYDVLKYRAKSAIYGTASVDIYPVTDLIRRFAPEYVMMDESHFLKNAKSARTKAVMSLVADIPYKRIASGTLNPDSPSDLPGQLALLDPTVLGSRDEFNERYGADVAGDRVKSWKNDGAHSIYTILPTIMEDMVWAPAKRKEWACALPRRTDKFWKVDLTERQRDIYNALFDDLIRTIRNQALEDKAAAALLRGLMGGSEEEDDGDDSTDLGPALQPFLADLERYVTDPAGHPYARDGFVMENGTRVEPLTGDDLLSPKALAVQQLLKKHFAESKGKVLVFVNFDASAVSIYNSMPPELRAVGILYSSTTKTENVSKFKTDPNIKWMIGIRHSLEVGLNLQVASRLIRVEGVWNPGQQEQGDSRIERPNFKKGGETREGLYFDTIVANKTIDVTKAARLRAKMVAVAKFENATDTRYQEIEDIPLLPMQLEIIKTMNDFETNLAPYQKSMADLNRVIVEDNEEYRAKIEAAGGFKMTEIPVGNTPNDAALMSHVPYAQGTELYSADDLGLVRVDHFLGLEMQGEAEDGGAAAESDAESDIVKAQRDVLLGLRAHCEYGDGIIIGAAAMGNGASVTRIHMRLDDGTTARGLHATNVFVQTRSDTNGIDMRNLLAKAAGLPVTDAVTVPGENVQLTKVTKKALREALAKEASKAKSLFEKSKKTEKIVITPSISIVNGFMRLTYDGKDKNTIQVLQAFGFRLDRPYVYTRIKTVKHLLAQSNSWLDGGFNTSKDSTNDAFVTLVEELSTNGLKTARHYNRLVGKSVFDNYLRKEFKPSSDKKQLTLFALVTDAMSDASAKRAAAAGADPAFGVAYLCLPYGGGFPATNLAIQARYKVPATRWVKSEPTLSLFVQNTAAIKKVFAQLVEAGIKIDNLTELSKMARNVKRLDVKKDGVDVLDN